MILKNVEDIYPATFMQQLMLLHMYSSPDSDVLCEKFSCTVSGKLNVKAFKRSWQKVVDRHAVLRTMFVWGDLEKPLQIVRKQVTLPWVEYDLREIPEDEQRRIISESNQKYRIFNPTIAPLIRLELFRLNEETYYFSWGYHHLILDGWCNWLILNEVFTLYSQYSYGRKIKLNPPVPYRNYIAWLKDQDMISAKNYWAQYMQGFKSTTSLPFNATVHQRIKTFSECKMRLDEADSLLITNSIRTFKITLNTLIQFSWAVLLSSFSEENDVVFGSTVSGRPSELLEIENMMGLFINNVPVRIKLNLSDSLEKSLKKIHVGQMEMKEFEYAPLTQIHNWCGLRQSSRLFESLIVFENYPVKSWERDGIDEIKISGIKDNLKTNYPLTLVVVPESGLTIRLIYSEQHFNNDQVEGLLNIFKSLLLKIAMSNNLVSDIQAYASNLVQPLKSKFENKSKDLREITHSYEKTINSPESSRKGASFDVAFENKIVEIWKDCLLVSKLDIHDNFFELGGNSLMLVQLHEKLQLELELEFSIIELFKYPTISSMSKFLYDLSFFGKTKQYTRSISGIERGKKQREAMIQQRNLILSRRERK
ncbi:condensation domain-containing protein [Bacillus wiedmannii]|uniref:condensation domain-containing protein n=1 Tax=Bacillus wiedmannii TaxID=1890302 RepID=UPI000BF00EC5|nr:condensation domain-containing protein [Bacillus wiedmannii]PEL51077.1 hypothetical protein CN622_30330 [Bacillus wiedmannii]PEO06334.1 hypothetical protein CN562_29185 [Bacillus wiedmannii]PEP99045.1 hypothetical protein CN587_29955 [Bacillus wiedmannii]